MSWLSEALDHLGGVGKTINAVGGPVLKAVGTVTDKIPVVGSIQDALQGIGDLVPGSLDPFKGGSSGGLSPQSLLGGGGTDILGLLQGINAAGLMKKSSDYANQASDLGMQNWNAGAPLRDKARAGILNPTPIDLSSLQKQRQVGNPFALAPAPLTPPAS